MANNAFFNPSQSLLAQSATANSGFSWAELDELMAGLEGTDYTPVAASSMPNESNVVPPKPREMIDSSFFGATGHQGDIEGFIPPPNVGPGPSSPANRIGSSATFSLGGGGTNTASSTNATQRFYDELMAASLDSVPKPPPPPELDPTMGKWGYSHIEGWRTQGQATGRNANGSLYDSGTTEAANNARSQQDFLQEGLQALAEMRQRYTEKIQGTSFGQQLQFMLDKDKQ